MKILYILLFLSISLSQTDSTKISVWKNDVISTLNYTNTSFDNWVAGGEDAYTWQLDILAHFNLDKTDFNWSNTVKLSYGKTKVGDLEAKKTSDEIKLESVYTYKLGTTINPYIATTGQTQFSKSYDYKVLPKTEISTYLDPAYFTQSIGVGYSTSDELKTRFGFSIKETIATQFLNFTDDATTTKIEDIRVDYGAELVADLNKMVSENIRYSSKIEFFSDFSGIKYVDVSFDNLFSAKVSDFISVSFNYKITYDRDIHVKRQIKKILAAGVTYSFL